MYILKSKLVGHNTSVCGVVQEMVDVCLRVQVVNSIRRGGDVEPGLLHVYLLEFEGIYKTE